MKGSLGVPREAQAAKVEVSTFRNCAASRRVKSSSVLLCCMLSNLLVVEVGY